MNNILVTGSTGQLGSDVVKELLKRGYSTLSPNRSEFNLCSEDSIRNYILNSNCEAIVHCAAYTQVDKAEDEKDLCIKINATATKHIVKCAKILDIPMIYISTDYVFDGMKGLEDINSDELDKSSYLEYKEDDKTNPQNIYGQTKLEGELYVKELLDKYYIVRISWVFGENGNNFIDTMLRLSKDRDLLNVINDQVGSPTYTKDLSRLLVDMIETNKYGIYHATNEGFCSWYDFAKEIFNISGVDIKVNPIETSKYPTKATRPMNSKMSKEKLTLQGFCKLRNWKESLEEYIN